MHFDPATVPRVLLVGVGPTAADAFAALHPRFSIVGLIRADHDTLALLADEAGIPVIPDTSIRELERMIAEAAPDCVVVSSYDRLIPERLLKTCPFINVHYAPLPSFRGRATVNWAIINGESETAITIHRMAVGLDAGEILRQERVPIGPNDTVTDLYRKLNQRQRELLGGAIADCLVGRAGDVQDEAAASYCCTRVPEDGEIDWSSPSSEIDRLVRALADPYPGAFTYLGTRRLWVRRAEPVIDPPVYVGRIPGRVISVAASGDVDVLTGDGVYRLREVRMDGDQTSQPASAVIRSVKATLGMRLAEVIDRLAVVERELLKLRART